jgi:signal transduction histidine kinase
MMRFNARTRFAVTALAAAAGIALVVGYGWRALEVASDDAKTVKAHLVRMGRIERLEEEMHELAAGSPDAKAGSVSRLLADIREHPMSAQDSEALDRLAGLVEQACRDGSSRSWSLAAEALSDVGKRAVEDAVQSLAETSEPVEQSARQILKLGATVALVCGVLAAFALMRLRRERREAELILRRNDRLAVLGTMAASVAHEINNPLATISGCATAVRDRLQRSPAGHGDEIEYLGMIVDETRRCTGIVGSLRDLARDTPPAMAPYDLPRLVREVVALAEMSRSEPSVSFEVAGDPSLEVVCDPDKVKQLVLNLLVNARDACSDGGRVRVLVQRAGEAARLVVEDDGRGISRDDLARVFEPFRTGKTRGLGLGLFVCERVASLHRGTIRAESDGPGRGARFTVTLPLNPPAPAAAGTAP